MGGKKEQRVPDSPRDALEEAPHIDNIGFSNAEIENMVFCRNIPCRFDPVPLAKRVNWVEPEEGEPYMQAETTWRKIWSGTVLTFSLRVGTPMTHHKVRRGT